jgi:hypothetical protein
VKALPPPPATLRFRSDQQNDSPPPVYSSIVGVREIYKFMIAYPSRILGDLGAPIEVFVKGKEVEVRPAKTTS